MLVDSHVSRLEEKLTGGAIDDVNVETARSVEGIKLLLRE